jgi:lysophospholipase L1-like esterase
MIDKKQVFLPGPQGDVTPVAREARDAAIKARNEAETFSATTQKLQDEAISALLADRSSKTWEANRHGGQDTMVVFGDSMTESASTTQHNWWYLVGQALGLKTKKYGVGGMGFLNGDKRYGVQLDTALADSSVDRSKVRYVLVNGSTNDIGRNTTDLGAAVDSFAARVREAYPYADLIGLSTLCGANVRWIDRANNDRLADLMPQIRIVCQRLSAGGFHVIGNAHLWLLYNTDYSQPDGLHPNDQGHQVIASQVIQALSGGIMPTTPWYSGGSNNSYKTMSYTALHTPLPLEDRISSRGFYNYSLLPSGAQYVISIQRYLTLTREDVKRFAVKTVKDKDGAITGVQGILIPFERKLLPMRVLDQHEEIDSWPAPTSLVNTSYHAISQYFVSMNSDSRLANPSDAANLLYLYVDTIPYIDNAGNSRIYNMLDAPTSRITAAGHITGNMEGSYR